MLEPVPRVGCVCFWMVQINIINPISDLNICFKTRDLQRSAAYSQQKKNTTSASSWQLARAG